MLLDLFIIIKSIFNHRKGMLVLYLGIISSLYILMVELPALSKLFGFADLTIKQHILAFLLGLTALLANSLINYFPY